MIAFIKRVLGLERAVHVDLTYYEVDWDAPETSEDRAFRTRHTCVMCGRMSPLILNGWCPGGPHAREDIWD